MNEQKIDEIKNAVRELIQVIIQEGKPLSDKMKMNIALVMEQAAKRIQQLRQEEQPQAEQPTEPTQETPGTQPTTPIGGTGQGATPTGGQIPELEQAPHPSSNISKFRYEPERKRLYVQFLGKHPNPEGPIYSYEGVPQNLFEILRRGAVGPRTSGKNLWHTWKQNTLPSHGAAMYQLIREGGFPYQRIS